MDSHRWMDLDGSWVYSTNPRRQADNLLKYSTLPGRNYENYRTVADISRRSAGDRGKYGTIPGRYLNKSPMRGQSPHRLWSTTRLPQGAVLQDSTNWGSNMPPTYRSSTLGRMDQNTDRRSDARISEQYRYKWDDNIGSTYASKYERKRLKLPGDPYGEVINHSPSINRRQKGKLIQMDSIYGKWEADYILEKKMKELKYDDWEPLSNLPKALQHQLLSQGISTNMEYPQTEKNKSAMTNSGDTSQEKRSWWSKLVKSAKSGVTNPAVLETSQEKPNKTHVEQSASINHKQEVLKENRPQLRKRKVPPPYVPPPSYDYPHRIFPIGKEKVNHTREFSQKPITQMIPLHDIEYCQESREKVPRYSVQSTRAAKTNLTSSTNVRENREEAEEKQKFDPAFQSLIQGRKLPRAHSTWTGTNSDDFLDHIYESVEGRSSLLTHNIHNFPKTKSDLELQTDKIRYGMVSFPLQRDTPMSYTSSKAIYEENEATKRKNMTTANNKQHQIPPIDVRPPIPLHGVKLPRELGFSYASRNFQDTDEKVREEYIRINKQDTEQGHEGRRPLRVESKTRRSPKSSTNKIEYGPYSHTLPLKKQYVKSYMQEETKHGDSRKKRMLYQDPEFPRWREPGNVKTLPVRSRDHNRWRSPDGLRFSKKDNTSEHSNTCHSDLRRSQTKEDITEKIQSALSDEGEGLFVIDATCVVVRAEYIFPPVMEQVKFLPNGTSKVETSAILGDSESLVKKEKAPHYLSHSEPRLPLQAFPQKSFSGAKHGNQRSTEREASTLKERAVRILGLSIGELDYLNEARDQHKTNRSLIEAVNAEQGHTFNEQEPEIKNENNRKQSKIRNYKEMPCILEDIDPLPSTSGISNHSVHMSNSPMHNNGTEEIKELVSEQNVLIPDIQNISNNNNCSEPSNLKVKNNQILATSKPQESDLQKVNSDVMSASPSVVSDCMQLETIMNEQTQENVQTIVTEQNCKTSGEPLHLQVPEKFKQGEGMFLKSVEKECLVKQNTVSMFTSKNTSETNPITSIDAEKDHPIENQWQEKKRKPKKHTPNFANPDLCVKPDIQGRKGSIDVCVDSETDQTASYKGLMKAYARRPNYYAKDLREAVSRIRRHTAPDSDTDEDLEKPSSDSVVQISEECVTSCSSDTSDSEVTVILYKAEKDEETLPIIEDTDSDGMNGPSKDIFPKEVVETSPAKLHEGEFVDQSNIFPVSEQETVYDLNSCIREILQDLDKTEQEFFPSNEDYSKVSASSDVTDLPTTGKHHTKTGIDMESSITE